MRVVVDTNVLVSGLLSPFGPPAQIVRMVASGVLVVCHDARILSEYRDVLLRPKFPFPRDAVDALLDQIASSGEAVASEPLRNALPDRDDEPFLEVAVSGRAEALITGNLKHYPRVARAGVVVLSPSKFVERFSSEKSHRSG
jgi:putative PIN family toxin of toxin-antitoxin system